MQGYIRHTEDKASGIYFWQPPHWTSFSLRSASCDAGLWFVLIRDDWQTLFYLTFIQPPCLFIILCTVLIVSSTQCAFLSRCVSGFCTFFTYAVLPFSLPLIQGHRGLNKTMTKPLLSSTAQTLGPFTLTARHRDRIRNRLASPTHATYREPQTNHEPRPIYLSRTFMDKYRWWFIFWWFWNNILHNTLICCTG